MAGCWSIYIASIHHTQRFVDDTGRGGVPPCLPPLPCYLLYSSSCLSSPDTGSSGSVGSSTALDDVSGGMDGYYVTPELHRRALPGDPSSRCPAALERDALAARNATARSHRQPRGRAVVGAKRGDAGGGADGVMPLLPSESEKDVRLWHNGHRRARRHCPLSCPGATTPPPVSSL